MLTIVQEPVRPRFAPPLAEAVKPFNWSERLSLELIRAHTKTDDIPGVDDIQLQLYRDAAIESAEQYTGHLLACQRTISEPVQGPAAVKPGHYSYSHRLRYPSADGFIYLYGAAHGGDNQLVMTTPGTRKVVIPVRTGFLDLTNCCDPCAQPHYVNGGMLAQYLAGYPSVEAVPAGIVLGCLHYIAWVVEHPGDELLTMRNRLDSRGGAGVYGSNYIALSSGALEQWKTYTDDI
jgi:hypothetical protein